MSPEIMYRMPGMPPRRNHSVIEVKAQNTFMKYQKEIYKKDIPVIRFSIVRV